MDNKCLNCCLDEKDESFVKVIYEHKENTDGIITSDFIKKIIGSKNNTKQTYTNLINTIRGTIKDSKMKDQVEVLLEEYSDAIGEENGLYCEQYYSTGFKDAVKLITNCIK
jgi:hypothetical protein